MWPYYCDTTTRPVPCLREKNHLGLGLGGLGGRGGAGEGGGLGGRGGAGEGGGLGLAAVRWSQYTEEFSE